MNERHPFQLRRDRGVGIVTAVFLLVVIALLGVAIVGVSTSQQVGAQLDVQGARAYQAARAGIEWGIYQRLRNNMVCSTAGTSTSFDLPAGTTLSGFSVTVVCTRILGPDNGGGPIVALDRYRLVATGCSKTGGVCANANPNPLNSNDFVRRTVEVQL